MDMMAKIASVVASIKTPCDEQPKKMAIIKDIIKCKKRNKNEMKRRDNGQIGKDVKML